MGSKSSDVVEELSYSRLKDLRLEVDADSSKGDFAFCFWIYLPGSTPFPSTILRQENLETARDDRFLFLNKEKKIVLSPSFFWCKGDSKSGDSTSVNESPYLSSDQEITLGKWVHLCCEVSHFVLRIHVDGKSVEKDVELDFNENSFSDSQLVFAAGDGVNGEIEGYFYEAKLLPPAFNAYVQHEKDPPLALSLDSSSVSEIEEEGDGVWDIVGGKASCRRKFTVDVLLLNAIGEPVRKRWEAVALLVYADDNTPVQKSDDGESPLLASFDGLEFPSSAKPNMLVKGRASFKLKISQLSSKCENRLFRIKFYIPKFEDYPFLEVLSPPIRCISRSRNTKVPNHTWRKLSSGVHFVNGRGAHDDIGIVEPEHNAVCEARSSPPSKRVKLGCGSTSILKVASPVDGSYRECKSSVHEADKVNGGCGTDGENKQVHLDRTETCAAMDTECVGGKVQSTPSPRESFTDMTVFKYCLGGLSERALMLKEAVSVSSDEEIEQFANQVSLYSGCSHHRHQILIAKGLIEEGDKTWSLISQSRQRIEWEDVVFELEEQFMRISCCNTRSLTQQDFNFLRRISGCHHDYMSRENFDKLWRWLYPVAYTISREGINPLWASKSPKWIEGFCTKEEVEFSLQNPTGIEQPGTFILRFPTSRSWPHPDAGSLVITYVGGDYRLIHRLLSSDYRSGKTAVSEKKLQDLLLAEPELSRLKG